MTQTRAVWDRFTAVAEREGDKPAIVDAVTGDAIRYADLWARADRLAAALKDRPEPTVAVIGEPPLAALALVLACAAAERCFIPFSDREPPERLHAFLARLPGDTLVASTSGLDALQTLDLPADGALAATDLVWQAGPGDVPMPPTPLPFLVTHTSGSTGWPKAIAFSQATKRHRTEQSIGLFDVGPADRILSPTPLNHSLGQRHFFLALMTGATLIKAYPFRPDLWIEAVQRYQVTFAVPVATHLKILQKNLFDDPTILSSFRCLVTSSAPAEPAFKSAVLDRAGFQFWEIFGMTETACATAVHYQPGDDTAHLGQPIPGTTVRIGQAGPEAGTGEIEVLSDCLCDGYWNDPDRWAAAVTEDGYFRSGDLGRLDAHGNLIYLGRLTESFESGGLIVFPAEIERVISEHPAIDQCLVFGTPDPMFGNLISLAYTTTGPLEDRDLIRYARARLPKTMWPARLFRQDQFPLLASGKPDRRGLAARLIAQAQGAARPSAAAPS